MKWLKGYFGNQKKASEKESVIGDYVELQKIKFEKQMEELRQKAISVHDKTKDAHEASKELRQFVDDVVNKIAIVTGGKNG